VPEILPRSNCANAGIAATSVSASAHTSCRDDWRNLSILLSIDVLLLSIPVFLDVVRFRIQSV
jgi:hypothetical protein